MKKENFIFFCLLIWILTILYYFGFIKYSLLYASFVALIFTLILQTYRYYKINNKNINKINFKIIIFEVFIFYLNVKKHFYIDKKPLINLDDIIFSLVIFLLYLLMLQILGTNFYELYFITYSNLSKSNAKSK
jgi:hypothetical protein